MLKLVVVTRRRNGVFAGLRVPSPKYVSLLWHLYINLLNSWVAHPACRVRAGLRESLVMDDGRGKSETPQRTDARAPSSPRDRIQRRRRERVRIARPRAATAAPGPVGFFPNERLRCFWCQHFEVCHLHLPDEEPWTN